MVEVAASYVEVVLKVGLAVLLPLLALGLVLYRGVAWAKQFATQRGADQEDVATFEERARLVFALCAPVLLLGYFLTIGCGMPWHFGYC
jgi:hypothetical protein